MHKMTQQGDHKLLYEFQGVTRVGGVKSIPDRRAPHGKSMKVGGRVNEYEIMYTYSRWRQV